MSVEDKALLIDDEMNASISAGTMVGESATPVWALNVTEGCGTTVPVSIGAICALARLSRNGEEYLKNLVLIMEHLWQRKGGALL
eukprot:IDg19214t1